jgi:prepilin-type N-terminal cleavage/methylation domain-containing protein
MSRPRTAAARAAFTLIEMLVVITIIVLLASLALLVAPSFGEQQKTSLGASSVQGWLFVAKQRAYRDGLSRGVAFIPDPGSPGGLWVRQMAYIEQPDDFPPGGGLVTSATGNSVALSVPAGMDISTFIQPGDLFVLTKYGPPPEVHRIAAVGSPNLLTLQDPVSAPIPPGAPNYNIIRGPRALAGEPLLNLTQDVIVDFSTPAGFSGPLSQTSQGVLPPTMTLQTTAGNAQAWYVLFTPTGGLQLNTGNTAGKVTLWVRDSIKDSVTDGQPTLITVYAHSGAIGAFPINTDSTLGNGSLYYFTQNGLNSGM